MKATTTLHAKCLFVHFERMKHLKHLKKMTDTIIFAPIEGYKLQLPSLLMPGAAMEIMNARKGRSDPYFHFLVVFKCRRDRANLEENHYYYCC